MAEPASGVSRLTRADVSYVADLALLSLTEDELDRFTPQLAAVLEHAGDVEELDLDGVPPMSHPLALRNVFRDDEPGPHLDRDEVLAAAPATEDDRFAVPVILDEEK